MAKYLDDFGLSYLWQKIEGRSIPVKAVTKEEYDALSEEEKNNGAAYLVTNRTADGGMTEEQADTKYLQLRGGTMSGPLSVLTPTEGGHAVNKDYVDGLISSITARLDALNL